LPSDLPHIYREVQLKSKNHDMHLRGQSWQLKLRIPKDVHQFYTHKSAKFIEETLKTKDAIEARKLRGKKLACYDSLWTATRIKRSRERTHQTLHPLEFTGEDIANEKFLAELSHDPEAAGYIVDQLTDKIDAMAMRHSPSNIPQDFDRSGCDPLFDSLLVRGMFFLVTKTLATTFAGPLGLAPVACYRTILAGGSFTCSASNFAVFRLPRSSALDAPLSKACFRSWVIIG
jgi:hypothetical protein